MLLPLKLALELQCWHVLQSETKSSGKADLVTAIDSNTECQEHTW